MGIAVVTGASRGIGLEFCRQLKGQNFDVLAVCRTPSPSLVDLGVEVVQGVDVTNGDSIQSIVSSLGSRKIDILINNAGVMERTSIDDLNFESIQRQFDVNSVGPLKVTEVLLNSMNQPSKIALITSRMGSIADNSSGGAYGYRMSKAALNAAGVSLAHDLKSRSISVAILHPGYVKTDMTGNTGNITTEESVTGLLARMNQLNEENSGTFWHTNGEVLPW